MKVGNAEGRTTGQEIAGDFRKQQKLNQAQVTAAAWNGIKRASSGSMSSHYRNLKGKPGNILGRVYLNKAGGGGN
jgi:hypothetical protein